MKKYELTDEHRAKLKEWNDRVGIANAMSTKPMDEEEREICRKAVVGMYEAAGLTPPPRERIVFVPSPLVLRFAGGFAAAIWWMRRNGNRIPGADATRAATRDATEDATGAATWDATRAATWAATGAATWAATEAATGAATGAATWDATEAATEAATEETMLKWYRLDVNGLIRLSEKIGLGDFGLRCASSSSSMWNGGNQWAGWASYLSFFRHVAKLDLDYSKWDHYEQLALHSGPRIMHPDFCMISDRPTKLTVNSRNQPHCSRGPFCEWSDGTALYSLNGVRVPAWCVETPVSEITKEQILGEKSTDVRRELIRRIGMKRLSEILDYKVIDSYRGCDLITFDLGDGRTRPYLMMKCPTSGLTYIEGTRPEHTTARAAWLFQHNEANEEGMEIVWER